MNKKLILVALLLTVALASAFTWGIGAAVGLDPVGGLPGSNLMMTAKFDQIPFLLGLGFSIQENDFQLGVVADWWALNQNLFSFVNIYVGPGVYFGFTAPSDIMLGGRVPIGLNIFPFKWMELFLEVAPTLAIFGTDPGMTFPKFGLQGAFGIRFWFK